MKHVMVRHLDDGLLRAHLDGELAAAQERPVSEHLATCERCRERLAEIEHTAERVSLALDAIAPPIGSPQSELALARTRDRLSTRQPSLLYAWRLFMNRKTTRAIATGTVVVALLVGVFAFAPTRTLARQVLSIFRVRKFAVVQVNPRDEDMEYVTNALSDTLSSQEPEVYVDEPVTVVADVAEASALAGFDVRMPSYFPGQTDPSVSVKGRTEMGMQLGDGSLELLFELAGMDPELAPDDLGDGMVRGIIPSMVSIENNRYTLVQVLDPVLEYPEGVEPALIGEAGLRIMGIGDKEAQRISEAIDWGNTLILPVPTQYASVRETEIGGHEAVMLIPADTEIERQTLMWEADDVVYVLSGQGAYDSLVRIAESMYD